MDWKMLSGERPGRLFLRLLFVVTLGLGVFEAKGQVYESAQYGYTIESLGTYSLNTLQTAMNQGDWDSYRKATLHVVLNFDEGSKVKLHAANTRPQPNMQLAIPDATPIADRTFAINPAGHLMMYGGDTYKH